MAEENKKPFNFFTFAAGTNRNTPVFSESKKEYIPYGDDNLYGEFLVDLMNTSSKHNSLIKKKVNMTVGDGFKDSPDVSEYIKNLHGKEDLNDIVFKNGYDLMLYGGFAIAVTWSKDKKTIARHSFIDFKKVRRAKVLDDESEMAKRQADGLEYFYISKDWSNKKEEPVLMQGFSEKYKDESTQLYYVLEYRAGAEFYTYPDYISSVDWIELDKEIANFHLSSVQNGFTPSMIISFKGGIPSDEEMKKLNKKIQKEYAGSDNASRIFTTYSESGDTAPEFIPVNLNTSDERFLQLEEQISQNIVVGHGASNVVAGVAVSGKLGSSDEIIEAEAVFQKNVIDAKQELIERAYNKLAKINGVTIPLELEGISSFDIIEESVDESGVEQPNDVEAEAKAKLRGSVGGVTSILDVATKVTEGTVGRDAGIAILEIIFGLSTEEANRMLSGVEEQVGGTVTDSTITDDKNTI